MVKIEVLTDFAERFSQGQRLFLKGQETFVEDSEPRNNHLLLKLKGIDDPESAASFSGCLLEVPQSEAFPLPPGQFYRFQLTGLQVMTTSGINLGRIDEILATGSNDVYVVHGQRGELLIPAIDNIIKNIDLDRGCITIEPYDDLLPPQAGKQGS